MGKHLLLLRLELVSLALYEIRVTYRQPHTTLSVINAGRAPFRKDAPTNNDDL